MMDVVARACALLEKQTDFAVAIILKKEGSGPRESGTVMLIEADGRIAGTIGGGELEARTQRAAQQVLHQKRPTVIRVEMTNDDAAQEGMICGGSAEIFIDYVAGCSAVYAELFVCMQALLRQHHQAWWGFYPDEEAVCRQCLVEADGHVIGAFAVELGACEVGRWQYRKFDVFTVSEHRMLYLKRIGCEGKAVLYGAGHVAKQLAPILHMIGFETVVMDDREAFANADRFPTADRIVVAPSLAEGILRLEPCDEQTYCIILTRGHSFDRDVLEQVLHTPAKYIGMIGSRNKRDQIYAYLRGKEVSEQQIARIHSPIGLAIRAQSPEEIAISIAAELIYARREDTQ